MANSIKSTSACIRYGSRGPDIPHIRLYHGTSSGKRNKWQMIPLTNDLMILPYSLAYSLLHLYRRRLPLSKQRTGEDFHSTMTISPSFILPVVMKRTVARFYMQEIRNHSLIIDRFPFITIRGNMKGKVNICHETPISQYGHHHHQRVGRVPLNHFHRGNNFRRRSHLTNHKNLLSQHINQITSKEGRHQAD